MAMKRAFENPEGKNDEWLTPPWLVEALGVFQLDPCAVKDGPWLLADKNFTIEDDGLEQDWEKLRAWMNPPFNRWRAKHWAKKMSDNNNGISLQIGKTEVQWFHEFYADVAVSMLLMDKRFAFLDRDGNEPVDKDGKKIGNCGGSPILVAFGSDNADALEDSKLGKHVPLNMPEFFGVNFDGTWLDIVRIATTGLTTVTFSDIYKYIQARWPNKCARNPFWKEQIRKCYYYLKQERQHKVA